MLNQKQAIRGCLSFFSHTKNLIGFKIEGRLKSLLLPSLDSDFEEQQYGTKSKNDNRAGLLLIQAGIRFVLLG
ncbi:hypothetical protein DSUL_160002 [Desulfovibrionales bacterium]